MSRQILGAEERLKLLEENEDDSNLVVSLEIFNRCVLNTLNVKSLLLCLLLFSSILGLFLQNIWLLAHEVLQELSKHERSTLILFFLASKFVLDLQAVVLHVFVPTLRLSKLLFNAFKF